MHFLESMIPSAVPEARAGDLKEEKRLTRGKTVTTYRFFSCIPVIGYVIRPFFIFGVDRDYISVANFLLASHCRGRNRS